MGAPNTQTRTIFETLADGLDAAVDGRGWGQEHERAKNLANASPDLLDFARMAASGNTDPDDLESAARAIIHRHHLQAIGN